MKNLDGQVAVVTGGGSGIGRATAVALATRRCPIALVDVDDERLADTRELLSMTGVRVSTHQADMGNQERVFELPDEVIAEHGSVGILINNAGVVTVGDFESNTLDELRWMIETNLWSVICSCKAFLPELHQRPEAHIVNLSSMAGLLGTAGSVGYSATKGGVRAFGEGLRAELSGTGIGLTTIHPGAIRTNIMTAARGENAEILASMMDEHGGLLGTPQKVAQKIVRGIEHNRARMVVGPDAVLMDIVSRIMPSRGSLLGKMNDLMLNSKSG